MSSSIPQRSAPQLKQPRNPISRRQVETVISRSIAASGLVFGGQAIPAVIGQAREQYTWWFLFSVFAVYGSFVVVIVFSILQRGVRITHALVSIIYVVVLLTWPLATIHPHTKVDDNPWLYLILTVATATAAIAFSTRVATIYLFAVPALYGVLRATPQGGGVPPQRAILDAVYAIILGGAIMIIVTMLRQASSNVDQAQGTALDRYSHAVRQHATEVERVQVDSIVHDSVLTTLLSAARAWTPEAMDLASTMASNAIGHLHDAALVQPDDGTTVRMRAISRRIVDAARGMAQPFELRVHDLGSRTMPVQAGEAIYSAAVQAMVNSIQHAGSGPEVKRWIAMRGVRPDGIEVIVGDTGGGFTVTAVPGERLGVRVSIVERVANSGGSAEIASSPSTGTVVTLRWPTLDDPAPGVNDLLAEELLGRDLLGSDLLAAELRGRGTEEANR